MSIQKFVLPISIILIIVSILFVYPSINRPVSAEQSLYSGNENHFITLQEGAALTKAYRISAASNAVLAHYFGKNAIEKTLAQPGCVGIRMYYGKHQDGSPAMIIVGVDHNGNDLTAGFILQKSSPCPPECFSSSKLKQDDSFANLK